MNQDTNALRPPADEDTFLNTLLKRGLLIPGQASGVYGNGPVMHTIVERLEQRITALGQDSGAEMMRFPPVVSRHTIECGGYLASLPHLLGSVHAFMGDRKQHGRLLRQIEAGQDWSQSQVLTDVVLAPAACYSVYPAVAGTLPASGRLVDVASYCFRHEPSSDPARMQSFRMHEFVRIADADTVQRWRGQWIDRGIAFACALGLSQTVVPATDPFFGPGGRVLALDQIEQNLKYELQTPITDACKPTAIMSFNYHRDHFGSPFDIKTDDGATAHTACIAFGIDRIALALCRTHGFEPTAWPISVRTLLQL